MNTRGTVQWMRYHKINNFHYYAIDIMFPKYEIFSYSVCWRTPIVGGEGFSSHQLFCIHYSFIKFNNRTYHAFRILTGLSKVKRHNNGKYSFT